MAIFDTGILISALAGEAWAEETLEKYSNSGLSTTSINKYELLKGRSFRTEKENRIISRLLENLSIRDLDDAAISRAAQLFDELKGRGKMIDEFDILIAAISITNNEILVVSDKHFDSINYEKIVNIKHE
jgi:predicted nucleic acid-binding protein